LKKMVGDLEVLPLKLIFFDNFLIAPLPCQYLKDRTKVLIE
jgi:hypothetical protein